MGRSKGDAWKQWMKTLFLLDFRLLRFINVTYEGKQWRFPLILSDKAMRALDKLHGKEGCCDIPNAYIAASPLWLVLREKSANYAIYCNQLQLDMSSEDEMLATIYHELGHYFCGHLEQPDDGLSKEEKENKEFEADAFAVRFGFGEAMISTLKCSCEYGREPGTVPISDFSAARIRRIRRALQAGG